MLAHASTDMNNIPQDRIGVANIARQAFERNNLVSLAAELLIDSSKNQNNGAALMDLSIIEQLKGNMQTGMNYQRSALQKCNLYRTKTNNPAKLRLLVLAAPINMGGNTPIEFLLADANVEILTIYVAPGLPIPNPLPDHDLVFVAAPGDSGELSSPIPETDSQTFLLEIKKLLEQVNSTIINDPDAIFALERDKLTLTFAEYPHVTVPDTQRYSLRYLDQEITDYYLNIKSSIKTGFPFVIRPVGSHAGYGLELIKSMSDLKAYLSRYKFSEYFISSFIDYRSEDQQFRKYRIIFIDGTPFPCHMAIGDNWKLWYMNANMEQSVEKRAEEERFMYQFDSNFAIQHQAAFQAISEKIKLDYFGIDCAVDREGKLVVFEADNALIVHDMDSIELYPYKQASMKKIFSNFEELLFEKANIEASKNFSQKRAFNHRKQTDRLGL